MSRRRGLKFLLLLPVAVFLCCALPRLELPSAPTEVLCNAMEAALFLHSGQFDSLPGVNKGGWLAGKYPWMTVSYVGALKTYALAGAFKMFGMNWTTLRAVTVGFGVLALAAAMLLAAQLYGTGWALALGLWMATDPAFVLLARYDEGPSMLGLALKLWGIAALVAAAKRESPRLFFAGGFFLGLALWDKAHLLWFLAAGAAACVLWLPRRTWWGRRSGGAALLGLAAGALPLIAFNLRYAGLTLTPALQPRNLEFLGPYWQAFRWDQLAQYFGGRGYFLRYAGRGFDEPGLHRLGEWAWVLGGALGLWACAAGRRSESLRHFAFWATTAVLTYLAACLTPMLVHMHHMPMLYPFPYLAGIALAAGAIASVRGRLLSGLLFGGVLALGCAGNAVFLDRFYSTLGASGGADLWYSGFGTVERFCSERRAPVVVLSEFFTGPLLLHSGGTLFAATGYAAEPGQPARLSFPRRSGTLVVVSRLPDRVLPESERQARALFDRLLKGPGGAPRLAAEVPYSDGKPWAEIYEIR